MLTEEKLVTTPSIPIRLATEEDVAFINVFQSGCQKAFELDITP
jgi:hypothetical protein